MAIILIIIGAAVGGVLGWLLDRKAVKQPAEARDACEPTSA
jgi:F0F1-type ATP synthase assembly protein I